MLNVRNATVGFNPDFDRIRPVEWRLSASKPLALVIDADPDLLIVLSMMLKSVGYDVASAPDVSTACRLASSTVPALVLTDLRSGPNRDDLVPTELLRRAPTLRTVPLIVYSSWEHAGDRTLAMALGASLFVELPVDFSVLQRFASARVVM